MPSKWVQWFQRDADQDDDELAAEVERARNVLATSEMPFFRTYLLWLEKESVKPLVVGAHADMIASAARLNTFREVAQHLHGEIAKAKRLLEQAKGP